jgi:hypothetical protein
MLEKKIDYKKLEKNLIEIRSEFTNIPFGVSTKEIESFLESLEDTKDIVLGIKEKLEVKENFYEKLDEYFSGATFDNVMAMIGILNNAFDKEVKRIKNKDMFAVEERVNEEKVKKVEKTKTLKDKIIKLAEEDDKKEEQNKVEVEEEIKEEETKEEEVAKVFSEEISDEKKDSCKSNLQKLVDNGQFIFNRY